MHLVLLFAPRGAGRVSGGDYINCGGGREIAIVGDEIKRAPEIAVNQ